MLFLCDYFETYAKSLYISIEKGEFDSNHMPHWSNLSAWKDTN